MTTHVEVDNYQSVRENYAKVEQQQNEEIALGHYITTYQKPKIVSALGAIPKKNGKVRVILDCSRPYGMAVNDFASPNKFQYQTLQDAITHITPSCFLAKLDLSQAYRVVPHTSIKLSGNGIEISIPRSQRTNLFD